MDKDHEGPKEHAEDAVVQDPGHEQRDGVGDHPGLSRCGHERDDQHRVHEAEDGDGDDRRHEPEPRKRLGNERGAADRDQEGERGDAEGPTEQ